MTTMATADPKSQCTQSERYILYVVVRRATVFQRMKRMKNDGMDLPLGLHTLRWRCRKTAMFHINFHLSRECAALISSFFSFRTESNRAEAGRHTPGADSNHGHCSSPQKLIYMKLCEVKRRVWWAPSQWNWNKDSIKQEVAGLSDEFIGRHQNSSLLCFSVFISSVPLDFHLCVCGRQLLSHFCVDH